MTMLRVFLQWDEIFDRNRNDKLKKCLVAGWILGVKPKICFFRVSMTVFHRLKVLQILSGQKWEIPVLGTIT